MQKYVLPLRQNFNSIYSSESKKRDNRIKLIEFSWIKIDTNVFVWRIEEFIVL